MDRWQRLYGLKPISIESIVAWNLMTYVSWIKLKWANYCLTWQKIEMMSFVLGRSRIFWQYHLISKSLCQCAVCLMLMHYKQWKFRCINERCDVVYFECDRSCAKFKVNCIWLRIFDRIYRENVAIFWQYQKMRWCGGK